MVKGLPNLRDEVKVCTVCNEENKNEANSQRKASGGQQKNWS